MFLLILLLPNERICCCFCFDVLSSSSVIVVVAIILLIRFTDESDVKTCALIAFVEIHSVFQCDSIVGVGVIIVHFIRSKLAVGGRRDFQFVSRFRTLLVF